MIAPLTAPGTGILCEPLLEENLMLSDLQHTQDVCRSVCCGAFYHTNNKTTIKIKPRKILGFKIWKWVLR